MSTALASREEKLAAILQRVKLGSTVKGACREIGYDFSTFYELVRDRPDFDRLFMQAKRIGAEAMAQQCIEWAEQAPPRIDGRIDPGHVQWAKLRIDTNLKLLARWFPAEYGDKLLHAGHDGGAIKSESVIDVKVLAAQLRQARAAGVGVGQLVEGDVKALTDSSECFNDGAVSNESEAVPCSKSTTATPGASSDPPRRAKARAVASIAATTPTAPTATPTGARVATASISSSAPRASGASPSSVAPAGQGKARRTQAAGRSAAGRPGEGAGGAKPDREERVPYNAHSRTAQTQKAGPSTPSPQSERRASPKIFKNSQTPEQSTSCLTKDPPTVHPSRLKAEWSPEDYV